MSGPITDCGPDGGCEECDVCRYLNFLEWAGSVGKPDGSTIERNAVMEAYMREKYPSTLAEIATLNEGESSPRPDEREIAP